MGAGFQLFASSPKGKFLSLWRSAPRTCCSTSKSLPASVRCWIYWRNAHEPRRTEYHLLQGSADRARARVRARERPEARRHVRRRAGPHRRDPRRQDRRSLHRSRGVLQSAHRRRQARRGEPHGVRAFVHGPLRARGRSETGHQHARETEERPPRHGRGVVQQGRERHPFREGAGEARHCRRGGGEARSPGSGRTRRRGRGERRRRHRRTAVQRALAGVGDRHPRAAAAGASTDDRLRRDRVPAVEGARGGAGLREVPAFGTCAQGVAEEGSRAGVIFRAPRDCRVALSRASAPWHLGDQDKTEISEVDVPPVSKELKKRWSYFIRKFYETDSPPILDSQFWIFDYRSMRNQTEFDVSGVFVFSVIENRQSKSKII